MSYRCQICRVASRPGTPMFRHTIYRHLPPLGVGARPRQQIEKEIPVCPTCNHELLSGTSLEALTKKHAPPPVRIPGSKWWWED